MISKTGLSKLKLISKAYSVQLVTVFALTVPYFGAFALDGPSGSGGGGTGQFLSYDKSNGSSIALGSDAQPQYCRDFAKAADEGLYLIEVLMSAAKNSNVLGINPLPQFQTANVSTEGAVAFIKNPALEISPAAIEALRQGTKGICDGRTYKFSLNGTLSDSKGKAVVAWNSEENGVSSIELNPERWSSESLALSGNCVKVEDSTKCVENFRRIIAAHEILSLAYHHQIEGDRKYPLTSALKIWNEPCSSQTYFSNIYEEILKPGLMSSQFFPPSPFLLQVKPTTKDPRGFLQSNVEFVSRTMHCESRYLEN